MLSGIFRLDNFLQGSLSVPTWVNDHSPSAVTPNYISSMKPSF